MADAYLYFDGACRRNGTESAEAACGYVLLDYMDGSLIAEEGIYLGPFFTSNGAEYKGLIAGLHKARSLGIQYIHIRGDSELVCEQVGGEYRVRNPRLAVYHKAVMDLLKDIGCELCIGNIPREQNIRADGLARNAFNHSIEDYSRPSLPSNLDIPENAWNYLMQQRVHGYYRINFLLKMLARNYPDVHQVIREWCWEMKHLDHALRGTGCLTNFIVTA